MTIREQLKEVFRNFQHVVDIKLEDCKILNEYSVIVLYENDSDILICENSAQANLIYEFLINELSKFNSNKETFIDDEADR